MRNGWLRTHVFELVIEAIMFNRRQGSKKVIMPLRFSVRIINFYFSNYFFFVFLFFVGTDFSFGACSPQIALQKVDLSGAELTNRFKAENHLDQQDMVCIHTATSALF